MQQQDAPFWHRTAIKAPGSVRAIRSPPTSPQAALPPKPPSPPTSAAVPAAVQQQQQQQQPARSHSATALRIKSPPLAPSEPTTARCSSSSSSGSSSGGSSSTRASSLEHTRAAKFAKTLSEPCVDLAELRKLCWKGIPRDLRPAAWKLLLGYLPAHSDRREETLDRKRREYHTSVPQFFRAERNESEETTLHQILIDLPRTAPSVPLFAHPKIRSMMEHVLYIWAMLHPASSYVQGINDLATPIILVFLSEHTAVFGTNGLLLETIDVDRVPDASLANVEADSFWCLSKLLDGIQDNYTNEQPGIVRALDKLRDLVRLIDPQLEQHIERENAMYVEFSFRWINNLLLRELSLEMVIRLWDTYMSESAGDGFSTLHVYVCVTLLLKWSRDLKAREMPDLMLFLQHLPTERWGVTDIEDLLSQAYIYKTLYEDSHAIQASRR